MYGKIPSYNGYMPRRKPGAFLPLELEIVHAALGMRLAGEATFHGFGLANTMREGGARGLIGHGTLYKALGRLEEMGMLSSSWEEPPPAGRPRRRLYALTAAGIEAAQTSDKVTDQPRVQTRLALGTT